MGDQPTQGLRLNKDYKRQNDAGITMPRVGFELSVPKVEWNTMIGLRVP